MKLHKINIEDERSLDFIYKINKETALLTAKKDLKVNTMTIAWGSVGFLWYKPIIEVYVRESRYTLEFMESSEYFSVCFFPSEYKDKLIYLGTHSGRDEDKISKMGVTINNSLFAPYFDEANLVIILKKIYKDKIIASNFLDEDVRKKAYKTNDYHYRFVGEIVEILKKWL